MHVLVPRNGPSGCVKFSSSPDVIVPDPPPLADLPVDDNGEGKNNGEEKNEGEGQDKDTLIAIFLSFSEIILISRQYK